MFSTFSPQHYVTFQYVVTTSYCLICCDSNRMSNWKLLLTVGQLHGRCELLLSTVWNEDSRRRQYTANSVANVSDCSQWREIMMYLHHV